MVGWGFSVSPSPLGTDWDLGLIDWVGVGLGSGTDLTISSNLWRDINYKIKPEAREEEHHIQS